VAAGGPAVVVAAMRAHAGSESVSEECCAASINIAGSDRGREAVVAAGALTTIVAAMRTHRDSTLLAAWLLVRWNTLQESL